MSSVNDNSVVRPWEDITAQDIEKLSNKEDIEILCVVTQPDKPAGRGHVLTPPPVKILALENT